MKQPNTVLAECESTNDELRLHAEKGAPDGTWVSALKQSHGRGRKGREWEEAPGNLFLSILKRPPPVSMLTWVPLMAGVACVRAIAKECPDLKVKLKWPNDLVLKTDSGFRKLGGILSEAGSAGGKTFVIIGVGVNVAAVPAAVSDLAMSLASASSLYKDPNLDRFRAFVISEIDDLIDEFFIKGSDWARPLYQEYLIHREGEPLTWISGDGELSGKFVGVGPLGELNVLKDGIQTRLIAEDVKLVRK